MLKRLSIHNLAILENVEVSFQEGFTVLSGETGVGKSLIIGSLSLLLGARASSELIRSGEEKATVKGVFDVDNPRLNGLLLKLNIPSHEEGLVVERVISKTKSVSKINGVTISLSDLNEVAKYLADIHRQHDFQKLLNPENYLEIIDGFSYETTARYKRDYYQLLLALHAQERELDKLLEKKRKLEEARDFYEFQYNELKAASLSETEEKEIEDELSLLKNYDKVYSLTHEADSIIREDFLDRLYELNKVLKNLSDIQSQYQEIHDKLDDRYYEIDDLFQTLKKSFQNIDYDPERLNVLQQRESDLNALKRKYKKDIPELIAYRDELAEMIGEKSHFEEDIKAREASLLTVKNALFAKGKELTTVRKDLAKRIEKELAGHLKDLLLDNAHFEIVFLNEPKTIEEATLYENGLDQVDFLIQTNVGEGLKPLSKIVSGGEASRIMLALKAVYVKANKVSTVIFDEIDTGVSGKAGGALAEKMRELSFSSQVITISHLPQVGAYSDTTIRIDKHVKDGRTYTDLKVLSLDEKIEEIARLISDGKITDKQREYAREMVLSKRG